MLFWDVSERWFLPHAQNVILGCVGTMDPSDPWKRVITQERRDMLTADITLQSQNIAIAKYCRRDTDRWFELEA